MRDDEGGAGPRMSDVEQAVGAARRALSMKERLLLALYDGLMRSLPERLVKALVRQRAKSHPGEESAERADERVARECRNARKGGSCGCNPSGRGIRPPTWC